MKKNQIFNFHVSLSDQGYDHKPNRDTEVGRLTFTRVYTDIQDFTNRIAEGYCYCAVFKDETFTMADKTDANFSYSNLISLDIDHSHVEMNTMIDGLEYKPTMAYTSCSNGMDGEYRYRLIYLFEEEIKSCEEYYNYVYTLINAIHIPLDEIDMRSCKASQYYNGNGCGDISIYISNIVYNKDDFNGYYSDYYNKVNGNKTVNQNHYNNPHPQLGLIYGFRDKEFEKDYRNLCIKSLYDKYLDVYPIIEYTPLPPVDDDTPYILFPQDYVEVRRRWYKDGRPIKLKDGEGRRRKLFAYAIIRRLINPNITFDNLLFNMIYDFVNYITNFQAKNKIGKKELMLITIDAMRADISRYEYLRGADREFMVNPDYCAKRNLTKRQVKNMVCKMRLDERIGELYDCAMTDKENQKTMEEHGLNVSISKLEKWRKENGLTKYKKKAS